MRRFLAALTALVVPALCLVPSAAAQETGPVVSNGLRIQFTSSEDIQPSTETWCTLGPVGHDSQGRKVAITAGHCAAAPDSWYGRELTEEESRGALVWDLGDTAQGPIGYVRFMPHKTDATLDYMVIELVDDAVLSERSPGGHIRVDANEADGKPAVGQRVSKFGQTTGFTSGGVGWVNPYSGFFGSHARHGSGDSGGAVVIEGTGEWVGIISRITFSWPPYTSLSANRILGHLNPLGIVGSGFVPVDSE